MKTTNYIVKISGGCRAVDGRVSVDGEYPADYPGLDGVSAARAEADWFAERTTGGSIRIVKPCMDGNAVQTVEVVR